MVSVFPGYVVSSIHGDGSAGVRYWGLARGEPGVDGATGMDNDDLEECRLWLRLGLGARAWAGIAASTFRTARGVEVRVLRNCWFSSSRTFIASFRASCSEARSLSSSPRSATFIRSSATILFACVIVLFISPRQALSRPDTYLFK